VRNGRRPPQLLFDQANGLDRVDAIRVAGHMAALATARCFHGRDCVTRLGVVSLVSELSWDTPEDPTYGAISALVLKRDGATAYIRVPSPDQPDIQPRTGPGPTTALQVRKNEHGADVLLENSPDIDPRSLRLGGSRITWMTSGQIRTSFLR
jgi:hypothetical protein